MLVAAINTTPDTIVITDDQAKIKFMNHAAEELSGYTLADLKDEPITKLYPHDQKLIELQRIKNQDIENKDHVYKKHFLELVSSPLKDRNGTITQCEYR